MEVMIKKESLEIPTPEFKTGGAAGCDLSAFIEEEITIHPNEIKLIPTGISIAINSPDCFALLCARSGLSTKHGITLVNGVGIIDADYRGEIKAGLINVSSQPYTIKPFERIAQLIFVSMHKPSFVLTDELPSTERGIGGFGSTGGC